MLLSNSKEAFLAVKKDAVTRRKL